MVTHQELVDHMAIGTMCANGHGLADYVATYQHPNDPKNPTGWLEHIPLCTACATAAVTGTPPPATTHHPRRRRATRTHRHERCSTRRPQSRRGSPAAAGRVT